MHAVVSSPLAAKMTHCSPFVGGDHVFVVPDRKVMKGMKSVNISPHLTRAFAWAQSTSAIKPKRIMLSILRLLSADMGGFLLVIIAPIFGEFV